MGSFYTNIQVRGDDYKEVVNSLGRCDALPAYISKTASNKWISVYPKNSESQDQKLLQKMVATLSSELNTAAFGLLVHDSDMFWYVLGDQGKILDIYDSDPGYFSGSNQKASGGSVTKLVKYCVDGTTEFELAQMLHKQRKMPVSNQDEKSFFDAMKEGNIEKVWDMMAPGSGKNMARAMGLKTDENGKVIGALSASDYNKEDSEKAAQMLKAMGGDDEIFRGDALARKFGDKLGLKEGRSTVGYTYLRQGEGLTADYMHINAF